MVTKTLRTVVGGLVAVALMALAMPVHAQQTTVDDIIKAGKIRIMVGLDVPPFGSPDKNGNPEGYDIDVANMIGKDLGVRVEFVTGTSASRVPYLVTNKVDMVVFILGATPDRAKSIMFSIPYAPYYIGIYGAPTLNIHNAAETKGHKVGVARGSTQDLSFSEIAPQGVQIVRYDDDATAQAAFLSGQVDMLGTGNLIAGQIAKQNPGKINLKFVLRMSPGTIAVRRGDWDLLQWVNTFIFYHKVNGDLNKLCLKWFGEPMPELPVF
jgi:polar amino acid transport system substrate-binding protein